MSSFILPGIAFQSAAMNQNLPMELKKQHLITETLKVERPELCFPFLLGPDYSHMNTPHT